MSHSIFDALSVVSFEGSGELSVQQLLDSTLIQNSVTVDDQPIASSASAGNLVANCSSISVPEGFSLDEDDIFQCGRCKIQFSSLPKFMYHKRSECMGKSSPQPFNPEKEPDSPSVVDPQSLDEVSASISSQVTEVDESENGVGDYTCDLPSSEAVNSSVNGEGEFLNLAINGTQVFTLNGNLHLATTENEGKSLMNLNVPSTLLPAGSSCNLDLGSEVMTSPSLVSEVIENSILGKSEEVSIEATVNELTEEENHPNADATSLDHEFFHRSMVKNPSPKGLSPKVKSKHRCTFCEKEFSKNFDLQQHIRSHTGEKPFQCVVCGRPFAQKSNVKKHMATHKVWPKESVHSTLPKDPIKTIVTPEIQQVDSIECKQLKEEILVDDSYVCPFCQLAVSSYLKLRTHMKFHNDRKVYKCIQTKCNAAYSELDPFLDHIRKHVKDAQYRCHHCSKAFSSLHALAFHQLEHSLYPRPKKSFGPNYFRCTKCMNKYASAEALEHHRKTTSHHFPCQQCSKIFSSERLLRRHLHVHGTTQLLICPTCSKDFKSEYSLKLHLLTHTDERPFSCFLCATAFNRKDKLKRHMLIHEEKKFRCPFRNSLGCHREFRRGDKLRLHVLTHAFPSSKKVSSKTKGDSAIGIGGVEAHTPKRIKHFANIIRGGKHNSKRAINKVLSTRDSNKAKAVICDRPETISSESASSTQSAMVTRTKSGTRTRNDYSKYAESFKRTSKIKTKKTDVSLSSTSDDMIKPHLFDEDAPSLKLSKHKAIEPVNHIFKEELQEKSETVVLVPSADERLLLNHIIESPIDKVSEVNFHRSSPIKRQIKIISNQISSIETIDSSLEFSESPLSIRNTGQAGRLKGISLDPKSFELSLLQNDSDKFDKESSMIEIIYIPISLAEEELLNDGEFLTSNVVKTESELDEDSSVTLEVDSSFFASNNDAIYSKISSDNLPTSSLNSQQNLQVVGTPDDSGFIEFANRKMGNPTIAYMDNVFMSDDISTSCPITHERCQK